MFSEVVRFLRSMITSGHAPRAFYTQSLANPVRVGHGMATTALLGKHKTKEYTLRCDLVKPSWLNSVYRWLCTLFERTHDTHAPAEGRSEHHSH